MNNSNKFLASVTAVLLLITGCKKNAEIIAPAPNVTGLETEYYVVINEDLLLKPIIDTEVDSVVWHLNGKRVANALQYNFVAPAVPTTYSLLVMVYNAGNIFQKALKITTGRYIDLETHTNTIINLEAPAKFAGKTDLKWEVVAAPSELYRLSADHSISAQFATAGKGTYKIKISSGSLIDTLQLTVRQARQASAFIAKVFDYLPAPGQFVNELPKFNPGDTHDTILGKVSQSLVGEDACTVTLGGWGGYIVFGFDHTIVNVAGRRDLRIHGNAFGAAANPRPNAPFGGSCEPGIVMVAYDKNKNGKPDDDEWYEIKGSGNFGAEAEPWYSAALTNKNDVRTFRNYEMTFDRPATETPTGTPQNSISIANYIKWTDNQGQEGYKVKNTFHAQSYYPGWIKENKITYKGIRLAQNSIEESGTGSYFVLYGFRYGYVDNYPNTHDNSGIDIDWAIDKKGNKVVLPGIDFVKVYNGVDQENGWLGEASTEISRGEDLHLQGIKINTINP